jgi:hypothetical protein
MSKARCSVLGSEHDFALEDAIGSYACSLEALACVCDSMLFLQCLDGNSVPTGKRSELPRGMPLVSEANMRGIQWHPRV